MKTSTTGVGQRCLDFESTSFAARFRSSAAKSEKKQRTRRGKGCNHRKTQEVVAEVHSPIPGAGPPEDVRLCRRRWIPHNCSFFEILENVVEEAQVLHFSERALLNSQGLRRIASQDYRQPNEVAPGDPGGFVGDLEAGHDERPEVVVKVAEVAVVVVKRWDVGVR
jgi:hypothetical protein